MNDEHSALAPERVARFVSEHPWAILPSTLDAIVEVVRLRASGQRFTEDEIRARLGGAVAVRPPVTLSGRVQVIPVFGVLGPRMNSLEAMSGGTSTEQLGQAIRQAVADASIGAIVLDVNSPGGSVFGMQELADVIHAAARQKTIVAVANPLCASAAFCLASQCTELVATPSAQVGSIGVLALHKDLSAAAEKAGVKVTYVIAGKYKADGQPYQPLSDGARAAMQSLVDEYYGAFTAAVARGRKVSVAAVKAGFGEGRVVSASAALDLGMIDRLDTLEATVDRLNRQLASGGGLRAATRRTPMDVKAETIEPTDGKCPDGYTLRDGMCHKDEPSAAASIAALQAQLAEQSARLTAATTELARANEERRQVRIVGKADAVKVPALRPFIQALLDLATRPEASALAVDVVVAGTKKSLTAEAVVDALVAELNEKSKALFLETSIQGAANPPGDDPGAEVVRRAKEYQAKHPGTDYAAAQKAVLAADPDLKAAYARS